MPPPTEAEVIVNPKQLLLAFKIMSRLQNLSKMNLRESDPIALTIETLADVMCEAVEQGNINNGETADE